MYKTSSLINYFAYASILQDNTQYKNFILLIIDKITLDRGENITTNHLNS